uniref:Uncharacterized protein n=1 Tax=Lepeophtheirus salmonis TaxID=72036 RepID=A0A0K2VLJ5_LEPSM
MSRDIPTYIPIAPRSA